MNFEETIVGKLTEVYQTVHLKEFTDFPKKDEKDPTEVFTDIHFWGPPAGDLLLMKPITCHMDYSTNEQVEIHPQVEGHLMNARVQGE